MREKLIELLQGCFDENVEPDDPYVGFDVNYGNIADYLIANGVTVAIKKEKPPTDLTGKCGGCAYAEVAEKCFGGSLCYVRCTNQEHIRRYCRNRNISMIRQRTTKACKQYKAKEGA